MEAINLDDLVYEIEYYNHRVSTPNWEIEDSVIGFTDLTYIVNGRAEYVINGEKQLFSAGDLVCIPAGSRRSASTVGGALIESHCMNGRITNLLGQPVVLPFPLAFPIGHRPEILSLHHEMKTAWLLRDEGYRLRVRALALMILHSYIQLVVYKNDISATDVRIKRVLRHVIDHYSDALNTGDMAEMVGLSPMYFGSLFKQETGVSFKQYVNSIRLNHAEDMLCSGEFNVNEVAAACGFSDIFYFSKMFKEFHGVSPSRVYRFGKKRTGAENGA